MHFALAIMAIAPTLAGSAPQESPRQPLLRTIDLDMGESREVELSDGAKVGVKLLGVEETRDGLRAAIREARVTVEVNGQPATLDVPVHRCSPNVAGHV